MKYATIITLILFLQNLTAQDHSIQGSTTTSNKAGVYGENTSANGSLNQFGVYGIANSSSRGHGVYGKGQNVGTLGESGVIGLYGWATAASGFSGWFEGGQGVMINKAIGAAGHPLVIGSSPSNGNGAHVTNMGVWTNGSSRTFKTNGVNLDKKSILKKISKLAIEKWNYIGSENEWHVGPYAEDFYKAFQLGSDPKYIQTVDIDGIALVAIQALYDEIKLLKKEIKELKKKK